MSYKNPAILLEPAALQQEMANESLRIFDTAVYLTPQAGGGYQVDSGRDKYEAAHLPGAGFIDLVGDWADTSSPLGFTLPAVEALAEAAGASGISSGTPVVLYSNGHPMWATRAFWLLQYLGHTNTRVLNGGLSGWQAAGLPVENGQQQYPAALYQPNPNPAVFASLAEVEGGMHGATCTINALPTALYEGTGDFYYKRRGHIPGSLSLTYDELLDGERFAEPQALEGMLNARNMLDAERVITYCGGGIAATVAGFACLLCGKSPSQVGVYDGSMSEWVQDDARPLTEGSQP